MKRTPKQRALLQEIDDVASSFGNAAIEYVRDYAGSASTLIA